jgi:hypothetical protein
MFSDNHWLMIGPRNLAMCAIVMGLWRNAVVRFFWIIFLTYHSLVLAHNQALHANISIPFIMLVEMVIGSRMVINLKEHCSRRLSSEPIMITGSIRFAGVSEETSRLSTTHVQSNEGDEEMQPVHGESVEVITYEES